ncbi:MAG: 3-deoxy-manno-octulosonate cytidylyltransferase [Bacteriovoracia bacterium]
MHRVLVLIPARYASTRFPGKPLALLGDKTLIRHVYDNCLESGFDVCVVTDDDRIESHIKEFDGKVVRVDDYVISGTERIELAYRRFFKDKDYDLVINVQGDEPLLKPQELKDLADLHLIRHFDIMTMVKERSSLEEDYTNPNVVKAVYFPVTEACPYFSRASVPFNREGAECIWYQHIGVYSFRPKALRDFCKGAPSQYEQSEKLEQLRALEMGLLIGAKITNSKLLGVDTPQDLDKVTRELK